MSTGNSAARPSSDTSVSTGPTAPGAYAAVTAGSIGLRLAQADGRQPPVGVCARRWPSRPPYVRFELGGAGPQQRTHSRWAGKRPHHCSARRGRRGEHARDGRDSKPVQQHKPLFVRRRIPTSRVIERGPSRRRRAAGVPLSLALTGPRVRMRGTVNSEVGCRLFTDGAGRRRGGRTVPGTAESMADEDRPCRLTGASRSIPVARPGR